MFSIDQDPKEFLRSIRFIERRLETLNREIDRLEAEVDGLKAMDYSGDRVSGRETSDICDRIIIKEERISKVVAERDRLVEQFEMARRIIYTMPTLMYQNVLLERYILNNSWKVVAKNLNFSVRGIFKIHGKALAEFRNCAQKCIKVQ